MLGPDQCLDQSNFAWLLSKLVRTFPGSSWTLSLCTLAGGPRICLKSTYYFLWNFKFKMVLFCPLSVFSHLCADQSLVLDSRREPSAALWSPPLSPLSFSLWGPSLQYSASHGLVILDFPDVQFHLLNLDNPGFPFLAPRSINPF